jgi:integrase
VAKLTDQFIRVLQVPEGAKDIQVFDDKLPGFGVRKFASGKTSFFVKYTVGKQQRRKKLGWFLPGTLDASRKEASRILLQAHAGVDVVADRKRAAQEAKKAAEVKTLGELVPVYLRVREFGDDYWSKLRSRTIVELTRYLTTAWQPLHNEPVDKITRQMVRARRDEIVTESGRLAAKQAHVALSTFFKWAIDRDHVAGANPTTDIRQLETSKRDRVLSEPELVDIWQACGDRDFGRIVRMLMLTGQRRQEIGGLEWAEISVERRQISLPAARCKNNRPHIVPLSEPAMALLQGLSRDGKYVFGGFTSWPRGKDHLDKRIAKRRGVPLPHWTLHDIRRSVVTHINNLGFAPPHVVEAIVNHVSGNSKNGVAGVYNRAEYLAEREKALEQWGRYLTGLVSFPLSSEERTNPAKSEAIARPLSSGTRLTTARGADR